MEAEGQRQRGYQKKKREMKSVCFGGWQTGSGREQNSKLSGWKDWKRYFLSLFVSLLLCFYSSSLVKISSLNSLCRRVIHRPGKNGRI